MTEPRQQRMIDVPVICGTDLAPGHDGRSEIIVSVRYSNGAVARLSLDQESIETALAGSAITDLAALHGQPWSVLFPDANASTTHEEIAACTT